MIKALLTGIGGSIGCHVFSHLMANTDWHVVGIDSFRHKGWMDRVQVMLDAHPEWRPRLTLVTHDLTAPISPVMADKIGQCKYILNLASLSDVFASIVDPVPFVQTNVASVLTVLEFARAHPPKVFLQVSSDEVYGPTDGKVFHKEWDPIVPSNPYSASKAAQEAIAISYWRTYAVPLVIVNLMNNFGEMQSPSKFPAIVQERLQHGDKITIHGTPDTVGSRHYIHSRNSADAFLFLMTKTNPHLHVGGQLDKPDRYNIVGDAHLSNEALALRIAKHMGKVARIEYQAFDKARPGHDRHYGLDGSKLAALGWRVPKPFDASLQEVIKWQQEHPEWLRRS